MSTSIDPLSDLIQHIPSQSLIAAALLSVFCAWLVAFRRQQRRLKAMQMQLDELRRKVRRLEADYDSLLVRFLNLSGSLKSLTVTGDQKDPSMVPEKPEIVLLKKETR